MKYVLIAFLFTGPIGDGPNSVQLSEYGSRELCEYSRESMKTYREWYTDQFGGTNVIAICVPRQGLLPDDPEA